MEDSYARVVHRTLSLVCESFQFWLSLMVCACWLLHGLSTMPRPGFNDSLAWQLSKSGCHWCALVVHLVCTGGVHLVCTWCHWLFTNTDKWCSYRGQIGICDLAYNRRIGDSPLATHVSSRCWFYYGDRLYRGKYTTQRNPKVINQTPPQSGFWCSMFERKIQNNTLLTLKDFDLRCIPFDKCDYL